MRQDPWYDQGQWRLEWNRADILLFIWLLTIRPLLQKHDRIGQYKHGIANPHTLLMVP